MGRQGIGVASIAAMAAAMAGSAKAQSLQENSAPAATAASAAPGDIGTADIVVTAQKRSESVQKIPLAVSAIGGEALQRRAATDIAAIGQVVPGLNVSEQVGQARLAIRGIGLDNISNGAEGGVALNQDGVFYSRSVAALASFYDIERVEVLRGPQGTLYGRNATGGSINILTNRPTDEMHAGIKLTAGNRDTANGEGFISGSIADNVSGRLSFQVQHHGGYGKNIVTGNDIDNRDSQAIRGQLLFEPTEKLEILLAGDYFRSKDRSNVYHYLGAAGQTPAGEPIVPTGLVVGGVAPASVRDIANETDPHAFQKFYGFRLDASYEISDAVSLRSLSAYRYSFSDVDTQISPFSKALFPLAKSERSRQYSQEFNLNVDSDRNKLVVGVYYLHENILGTNVAPFNLLALRGPDTFVQGFFAGGTLKTDAAAAFAQDTYSVTDRLRLTVGARYSWERKHIDDRSAFDFARPFSPTNTPLVGSHVDHKTFKSFTPKIGVDFDVAPRTLLYASFSKGFKSGTYNLGAAGPALNPEKIDAYEAGLKSTFLEGRLRANVAGFYYDYTDLQVGKVQGQLVVLENAASARIYGLEGEFTAKPIDDLTLSLNASWLHARFRQYATADQARPGGDPATGLPVFNLAGNALSQAPDYTISLAGEYAFHLPQGTLTLRGESNWSDRVYFTSFNLQNISQPAYSLQNAFVVYEPTEGRWSVTAFIKNIANKTVLTAANVTTTLIGSPVIGFVQPPRTYGATISYRY